MIPVAGRRRGQAPAAASSSPTNNTLDWLLGDGAAPEPAMAPQKNTPAFLDFDDPPAASRSRPAPQQNTPAFLDFDDPPAASRSRPAPQQNTPAFLDFDDPPAASRSRPAPQQNTPAFLDFDDPPAASRSRPAPQQNTPAFLDFDDPPAASRSRPAPQQNTPAFLDFDDPPAASRSRPAPQQNTPAFLDFDDPPAASRSRPAPQQNTPAFLDFDDPPAASRSRPAPQQNTPAFLDFDDPPAASRSRPAPQQNTPQGASYANDTLQTKWQELRAEMGRVEEETVDCEKRVAALESEEGELCAEVKLLGEKVRIKEEELESMTKARLVAEDECKSKRDRLREDLDASGKQTLLAAHELMRMQYEDGLELLKAGVGEQTESLAAVIERHSTMDKSLSSTEPYDRAVGQLMGRLKSVLQHISSTVCLRVKPLLTCRIRENGARFAQQRLDLLSNDRNLRYKQLEAFRHNAAEAFSTFRKERRRQHQTRVDEVFGQSIFKAKSGLEGRLTASRQQFVQRHSAYIAEMHKSSQMTIDELVRKSTDDLMKLKGKQQQELKHAEERFSAELAHHARLFAAERDAAARCHHKACLPDFEVAMPSVNETLLKDTRVLRERLEQLKQSVLLDVQEASSLAKRERCDPLSIVEKERMLGLLEERTRHLSHQFTAQWHRFKSTVTSLQQDVENMSHGLREGRVRAAAYQQEVECVYSEWSQHVRRELSRCLVSGGAPSDASGVESGLNCMVQVIQRLLEQVRSITGAQCGRREEQRKFETGLRRELSSLTVKRELSRRALHGLLDAYEGLSSATAELEARRRILEVAQNDFKIAIELHEKERNEFERRVKKAEEAGVRLRHNSMKLERRSLRHGHSSRGFLPSTSCGVTIDNALNRRHHCASSMAHVKQQLYGLLQHGERLGDSGCSRGACRKRSVCAPSDTGSISRGENLMEFVSLLSLDDCALRPIASSSRETGELPSGSSSLV